MRTLRLAAVLLLGWSLAVAASEKGTDTNPDATKDKSDKTDKAKKAKKPKVKKPATGEAKAEPAEQEHDHELTIAGRIDGRVWRDDDPPGSGPDDKARLNAARVEVDYRFQKWLRVVLEVDFGPIPPPAGVAWGIGLRDAFVRVGPKSSWVQFGHFKPPTSGIEMESSFTLPIVRRDYLNDALGAADVAGRRPGVEGQYAFGEDGPRLRAGLFRTLLVPLTTSGATSAAVRGELALGKLDLGAFAMAGTRDGGFLPYGSAGVDGAVDLELDPFGVRAWAEALAGVTPQGQAPYVAARAIVAPRWGGLTKHALYVEPYALVTSTTRDDSGSRIAPWVGYGVGLNVGLWKLARLQVEYETRSDGAYTALLQLSAASSYGFEF